MRLIDADAITYETQLEYQHDGTWANTPIVYKTDIDAQPTVDAVPVIRCKDCRYYGGRMIDGYWSCRRNEGCVKTLPEGFCGWAIPKMGEVEHETD